MSDSEFTYQKPDEQAFLDTLVDYLKFQKEKEIADLLEGTRCRIESTKTFSYQRWDGYWTKIHFYIPASKLRLVNDYIKRKLIDICDGIMPVEVGFDVMDVEFSPMISKRKTRQRLIEDLDDITLTLSQEIISQILPSDVKQKGKDMAEVYLYLYCVENSLRLFVEKVATEKFGDNYFNELKLSNSIKKKISNRKQQESKNKWLRLRGYSEIFYLDFKDLGTIIQNNWDLFSSYFPNQSWILTKIDELAECRNLVAHNSYIQSHEKDVIRVNYNSILKQFAPILKKQSGK
jgi:hypothetical protein